MICQHTSKGFEKSDYDKEEDMINKISKISIEKNNYFCLNLYDKNQIIFYYIRFGYLAFSKINYKALHIYEILLLYIH